MKWTLYGSLTFIFIFGFFVSFSVLCCCSENERKFERNCLLVACQSVNGLEIDFGVPWWHWMEATSLPHLARQLLLLLLLLCHTCVVWTPHILSPTPTKSFHKHSKYENAPTLTIIIGCIRWSIMSIWAWSSWSAIPHVVWLISVYMNHCASFLFVFQVNIDACVVFATKWMDFFSMKYREKWTKPN